MDVIENKNASSVNDCQSGGQSDSGQSRSESGSESGSESSESSESGRGSEERITPKMEYNELFINRLKKNIKKNNLEWTIEISDICYFGSDFKDDVFSSFIDILMDKNKKYSHLKPYYEELLYIKEYGWCNAFNYYKTYTLLEILDNINDRFSIKYGNYEEDINDDENVDVDSNITESVIDKSSCFNDSSIITGEEFNFDDKDMYSIYQLDNNMKFTKKGNCGLKSEVILSLKSDLDGEPNYIMSIGTTPEDPDNFKTGLGSKATIKIIFKIENIYVTLGSMYRFLNESNSIWYAVPLYNNKKRRIVNLKSEYGVSRNHGQSPGFKIYKLYKKSELDKDIDFQDYPSSYHNVLLRESLNMSEITLDSFIKSIVDGLIVR